MSFSQEAQEEIREMKEISAEALALIDRPGYGSADRLVKIAAMEQKIDDMTMQFRNNQMQRMRAGTCSDEACVLYSEMLTDFERIGDHILNIGQELTYSGFFTNFKPDANRS